VIAVGRGGQVTLGEQRPRRDDPHRRRITGRDQERFERRQRGPVRALPDERLRQPHRDVHVLGGEHQGGSELGLGLGEVALGQELVGQQLPEGEVVRGQPGGFTERLEAGVVEHVSGPFCCRIRSVSNQARLSKPQTPARPALLPERRGRVMAPQR
jgi:hypothetical protein